MVLLRLWFYGYSSTVQLFEVQTPSSDFGSLLPSELVRVCSLSHALDSSSPTFLTKGTQLKVSSQLPSEASITTQSKYRIAGRMDEFQDATKEVETNRGNYAASVRNFVQDPIDKAGRP